MIMMTMIMIILQVTTTAAVLAVIAMTVQGTNALTAEKVFHRKDIFVINVLVSEHVKTVEKPLIQTAYIVTDA